LTEYSSIKIRSLKSPTGWREIRRRIIKGVEKEFVKRDRNVTVKGSSLIIHYREKKKNKKKKRRG